MTDKNVMEIKVEVHAAAVGPSPPEPRREEAAVKKPYGAWCSPAITPETCEKVQVSSYLQPPPARAARRGPAEAVELRRLAARGAPSLASAVPDDSITVEEAAATAETPQSPVPSSPARAHRPPGAPPPLLDPREPIDPQGRAYISWLFLVTFCYSYNAWCVALRATFPYQTPQNTPYWMVADYLCDVIYLMDALLIKPRLIFLHEGFWVDDVRETRRNYRRKLQYKFDVLSLLPLDILYIFLGTDKVILRFPRLLKLQSFWEFHQAVDRVVASPYVVRIGKMLFYIFYLIHLNACAYYAMSAWEGLASNGWVYDNDGTAYIRCFYFATKTATSIGKNPRPENELEYLFMTAAWLMGVFVFALLIGQIRDIIATATKAQTEYRQSVDECTRFLRRASTPAALQRRVTDWCNYTWSQQRCFDESRILDSLPYNMKLDVALEVHMKTLSKVQLFRDCSSSFLRDMVLQLRPLSCLPGDVVVRRGDVGHHMYIVKAGECCVMSPEETEVLATLREGSVFGEISLLNIDGLRRRTATVRSRGYSSLFALSRADLAAALRQHAQAARALRRRADQLIRENAARRANQRIKERQARKASVSASASARRRASGGSRLSDGSARPPPAADRRRLSVLSETQPPRSRRASPVQRPELRPELGPEPRPELRPEPGPQLHPEPRPEPRPDMCPEPRAPPPSIVLTTD